MAVGVRQPLDAAFRTRCPEMQLVHLSRLCSHEVRSQDFSKKPINVEFVLVLHMHCQCCVSTAELRGIVGRYEIKVLDAHPETR
jgi:hypothetical protein